MMRVKHKRLLIAAAVVLMLAMLAIVGCEPKSPPTGGNNGPGNNGSGNTGPDIPAITLPDWTVETDCTSCHSKEVDSANNSACGYYTHSRETDLTCVDCHTDTGGALAAAHKDYATAANPETLNKTSVPASTCVASGCHVEADLPDATVDSTVLEDANGTVVNPHDLPVNVDHKDISCVTCHKQHDGSGIVKTAMAACYCHHEDVFECNTCH